MTDWGAVGHNIGEPRKGITTIEVIMPTDRGATSDELAAATLALARRLEEAGVGDRARAPARWCQ